MSENTAAAFECLTEIDQMARHRCQPIPMAKRINATWSGVSFRIGRLHCLVNLMDVAAIITSPKCHHIQGGPSAFVGLAQYRGELLNVVDLRRLLLAKDELCHRPCEEVIVVGYGAEWVGFQVDALDGLKRLPMSQIQMTPEANAFISATYNDNTGTAAILDLKALSWPDCLSQNTINLEAMFDESSCK